MKCYVCKTRSNLHLLLGSANCSVAHSPENAAAVNGLVQKELKDIVNERSKFSAVQLVCHCVGDRSVCK